MLHFKCYVRGIARYLILRKLHNLFPVTIFQVDPSHFGGWLKRRQSCRSQPVSVSAREERETSLAPNALYHKNGIAQRACKAHFMPIKRCARTGREGCTQQGCGKDIGEERIQHPDCTFLPAKRLGIYRPTLRTLFHDF